MFIPLYVEVGRMGLRGYIIKRVIYSLILVLFVITLNFIIFVMMPGSPIDRFAGSMKLRSQEQYDELMRIWGLSGSLGERYTKYLANMFTWNFGHSFYGGKLVAIEMMERLSNTVLLMGTATILSLIIGVALGVLAAKKRGSLFDGTAVVASLVTYSLPTFWMGLIALYIFYYRLGWFPGGGPFPVTWASSWPQPYEFNLLGTQVTIASTTEIAVRIWHLALPAAVLTLFSYGGYLLLTRATMLEALTEDYIVTARAKGLQERAVLFKHALKNASLPLITSAALSFGFLLSGAIITETVFTWPGLGRWIWDAITNNNYPVMQAFFYITALTVIIANFIADLLYGIIDPRIKYG